MDHRQEDNDKDHVVIRLHTRADTAGIVSMINREPYHFLNGTTAEAFERQLDEPGERIRAHTYVAEKDGTLAGYGSLCFVDRDTHFAVYCYGTVDPGSRRRGVGTRLFAFFFSLLQNAARQEGKPVHFIHRAVSRIPGETELGAKLGMEQQNAMDILALPLTGASLPGTSRSTLAFRFRSPTPDDAPVWAALYNDAFGGGKRVDAVLYEFQDPAFQPQLSMLCMNDQEEPVGLLSSSLSGEVGRIATIAVRRDRQHRGAGKALLAEALVRLQEAGAREARLTVDSRNAAAKSLYAKFGFQEASQRIHYRTVFHP